MRAVLKLGAKRSDEILTLNSDRCKLKSSLLHWSSCVPEEVALFIKAFRKEATEWREAAEADFQRIAGNGAFFPDFSFTRADDQSCVIHVELFHRCHAAALTERLKFLAENPQFPLIIGIDRSLSEKSEKDFVNQYGNIADKIFFFSNYPGVDRVRKMLNRFCKA